VRLRYPIRLALAYCVSRAAFFAAGVRFDTSPLSYFWQLLDPELLQHRLAESLWYLHAQPPLFNLLVGLDLKILPSHYGAGFYAFQLAVGLAFTLALYAIGVRVGLPRPAAAGIALLLAVAPSAVLYESFMFYDHLVICLVVLSTLGLALFGARPTALRALAFFAPVAALVWTRSLFHALWLVLLVALLVLARRRHARAVLLGAALPLALAVGLYVKNAAVFDMPPSGSSWLGMNLARTTISSLSDDERRRLVAAGELDPIALRPLFAPLERYDDLLPRRPPTGVPALDEVMKSTGFPNLNNATYIDVSDRYLDADLWVIGNRPGAYADGVGRAFELFFSPANEQVLFGRNRETLRAWERVYDFAVYGAFTGGLGVFLMAGYGLALLVGLAALVRLARGRARLDVRMLVLGYAWLTLLYGIVLGNLVDAGENYRFRVMLDPLVALLLASAATAIHPLATKALTKRRADAAIQPPLNTG
jgi:hypothetical protein